MGTNLFQNLLCFIEDDAVIKAKNGNALGFQISITLLVVCDGLGSLVNCSIALHSQLCLGAVEVADILPKLMLPPKLRVIQLPIPQQLPEHILRRRLLAPHLPRPRLQPREIKPSPIVTPLSLWERGWG